MSTLQTTIEWDFQVGEDVESMPADITVEYTYHRGGRGQRDSYGAPMEPDEPPSVEIDSVKMLSPGLIDRNATEDITDELTQKQREWLEEKCIEDVADQRDEALERRRTDG